MRLSVLKRFPRKLGNSMPMVMDGYYQIHSKGLLTPINSCHKFFDLIGVRRPYYNILSQVHAEGPKSQRAIAR